MKEAYEKKLQAQLNNWGAEINKLRAKADKAAADTKLEYQEQIEELKAMQETAAEKLAELREAGDDAWQDLKADIESAWGSLHEAIKSINSRFQ
jgi:argininosuccinate lyase